MRGRLLALVLALIAAGCVAPGADLQPANAAALDALATAIPDAVSTRLPNGDLLLTLEGVTGSTEEIEFEVPEGVTFVEAHVASADAAFSLALANAETRAPNCYPRTWTSWSGRSTSEATCTAIAASDPATTWVVRFAPSLAGDLLPMRVGSDVAQSAAYTLHLTVSTQPLDGPSAAIKLDALSRPIYKALDMEVVEVPASSDGAGLHVEITRPDTNEKVPVILRASPYNGPAQNSQGRSAGAFVDQWVARGYAVAVMDLRGTGKSDGCFSMRAEVDQIDIADVVEFVGTQDWSNGKVGMHGISYEGFTPVAAAVQAPEHLAAIFVGAPAVDTWSNYLPGGVQTGRSISTVASYTTGNAALTPADELPPDAVLHTVDAFCDPTIFPSGNDPRNLYDAWYAERNLTEKVANIRAPVYLEQGFWDNNVKANLVPDLFNAIPSEKRGVFGSWQHIWALRADEQVRLLAWMDQWLKGIDTGILETPVVEVLSNTREWRAASEWPPTDATYVDFEMTSGVIPSAPPALLDASPVPPTLWQEHDITERIYLSGVPLVDMSVSMPAGGNAHVEARIYETTADGEEIFAGVGWMNLAHRNGHDAFAPLAPGESAQVQLKMLPQDHVFQPGSTLRVELRSVTMDWGGPETGIGSTPGVVQIESATLRLPTLPYATLSVAPRAAS